MELFADWRSLSFDVETMESLKKNKTLRAMYRRGCFEGVKFSSAEHRLLLDAAADQALRLRVSTGISLSPQERDGLRWFVHPYSRVLVPNDKQSAALWDSTTSATRTATGSGYTIALFDSLAIPGPVPTLLPSAIATFEHAYWGLLAGDEIVRRLVESKLSGLRIGDVFVSGRSANDVCSLLCPENILEPSIDDGFSRIEVDRKSSRWMTRTGLWAYEPNALDCAKDFNVTGECIDELGRPLWVISKNALIAMNSDVLSDAAFRRPVLDSSTATYRVYESQLREFIDEIRGVSSNAEIL